MQEYRDVADSERGVGNRRERENRLGVLVLCLSCLLPGHLSKRLLCICFIYTGSCGSK